ncbi:hypothetical protein AURDEDRAFT_125186 [Auricularia subglabra TFB-10046 SS5]|uniref:Uncharacterized protein n=1 Tax=Auricularia subglabra (strain TFB-10046 / SS5) TaxID=717982 RepID=J0DDW7_AURST|nr:hypothetical protein AURDEDRAFT_125186 [Auricularia subglabra TFB-10046 SS5]
MSTLSPSLTASASQRLVIPARVASGVVICLDYIFTAQDWVSFLGDLGVVADSLGAYQFILHSTILAPYRVPNPPPIDHHLHLREACALSTTTHRRSPQFVLAVVPNDDARRVVQHFGLVQGIATQCISGHQFFGTRGADRLATLADAIYRLNVKLGGRNALQHHLPKSLGRTLILGGAITYAYRKPEPVWHCAIVAAVDCERHRWFTATSLQLTGDHRINDIGALLDRVIDLIGQSVSRVLYVRAAVPPYRIENTVEYVSNAAQASLSRRNAGEPCIAVVVPWGPDEDANSAEDYETVDVASRSYAIPFNEFGHGWDLEALSKYLATLTFNLALDNKPIPIPAPLKC